jgi:hypothetical protein
MSASAILERLRLRNKSREGYDMGHTIYIRCANRNCEAECGTGHAATYSAADYVDLDDGAVVDDRNGDVFCSQECYDECHPVYCADCGDEEVGKTGDRCTYCTIMAEQGEDAADAWYRIEHREPLRKPVASASVAAACDFRKKVV